MTHVAIGYRWFPTAAGFHLERALSELHHKVQYVGLSTEHRSGYGETTSIVAIVDNLPDKPELFLWVDPAGRYFPHDIETLPIPTACYLIDVHLGYWRKEVAKFFDVVFVAQKDSVEKFKQVVGHEQVFWLPLAASLDVHVAQSLPKVYDVGFVGNLLREHKQSGRLRRLQMIGNHFKINDFHRSYTPVEVGEIYSQSKIVFNTSIAGDVTMRLFEGTACGALVLTDQTQNGLTDLFSLGQEIVTYKDDEDMMRKIEYYLVHDNERNTIAHAGQTRTLANHTYTHRIQQMLEIIQSPDFKQIAPMRQANADERMVARIQIYTHLHMSDALFDAMRNSGYGLLRRLWTSAPCLARRLLR